MKKGHEKFYEFKKSNEEMTDLYIYGDITSYKWDESDVGAYDFLKELNDVDTDNLTVHINSYGGSVSEGLEKLHIFQRQENMYGREKNHIGRR